MKSIFLLLFIALNKLKVTELEFIQKFSEVN